jgi:hypothetical protein
MKMLCRVVCKRGDVKCLEDPVLNISSVCGRACMEDEVTIPGHCGILKGDGGGINRTVLEVCEENVNACGIQC